jgi:uridine kinase
MTRTLIVGIAGGSASGKTTLARALCDHTLAIGSDLISQDDY